MHVKDIQLFSKINNLGIKPGEARKSEQCRKYSTVNFIRFFQQLVMIRDAFKTLSHIYDGAFFEKIVNSLKLLTIFAKNSIIDA